MNNKKYLDILDIWAIKTYVFQNMNNKLWKIYLQLTSQAQRSDHFNMGRASRNLGEKYWRSKETVVHTTPKTKTNSPQTYEMTVNNTH